MPDTISVLMTTYHGERADRLARSLESMFGQTVPPGELVLVLDGGVGATQEAVIAKYSNDGRIPAVKVVRLPNNVGLGSALAFAQEHCSGDWIMRMDSDDISVSNRIEVQLCYAREHPNVDLIGGWAEEFFEDTPETRIKNAPADEHDLVRKLRWRNIIVHPSVMLRASTMRRVGGFRGRFPYLEDWDLFVRMTLDKARLIVLPQVLVRVNTSHDQTARRGGWRYAISDLRFRTFCWRSGFLRFHQYIAITPATIGYRLAGGTMRNYLYRFVRTTQA
jgi:glycosyltransferase involved in cell wall biosynthesis